MSNLARYMLIRKRMPNQSDDAIRPVVHERWAPAGKNHRDIVMDTISKGDLGAVCTMDPSTGSARGTIQLIRSIKGWLENYYQRP